MKTELKIFDLWYDFYARFLPGLVFVSVTRNFLLGIKYYPFSQEILVYIGAAYVLGIITQPLSSLLTDYIEKLIESKDNKEIHNFVMKLQKEIGIIKESHSKVIDKMHGETVFFVQLFFMSIIYGVVQCFYCDVKDSLGIFPWTSAGISIIFAFVVSWRRLRRAKKIKEVYNLNFG